MDEIEFKQAVEKLVKDWIARHEVRREGEYSDGVGGPYV
jgi:hypothetical protein